MGLDGIGYLNEQPAINGGRNVKTKILVMDDDPRIGRFVSRVAGGEGFDVVVVENPEQFDEVFDREQPQLIFLDLNMGGRDGVEILRDLSDRNCDATIILMSGMDDRIVSSSRHMGESLGLMMGEPMQKPVALEKIRATLRNALVARPAHLVKSPQMIDVEEFQSAIDHGDIIPYYQPQLRLTDQRIVGFEVLARWIHPEYGEVPPGEFIGLAEAIDAISELTYSLMRRALFECASLHDVQEDFGISFNLSSRLLNDLELPERIVELARETGFPVNRITLEMTEGGRIEYLPRGMEVLSRLRLKGIQLSSDDMGKGYATMEKLFRLPFSELKIDREFVAAAAHSSAARAIVESTINLGTRMNLRVVAAGVERPELLPQLAQMGCSVVQGYCIAEPMPVAECAGWLAGWRAEHGTGAAAERARGQTAS